MPVTRTPLVRAGQSRTSSLDAITRRRGGVSVPAQVSVEVSSVVAMPGEDANVLGDILRKAYRENRRPRSDSHTHVSDLISRCVRKIAIVERDKIKLPNDSLSLMDSLTFRTGDGIHDVIRERAAIGGPTAVWGNWKCKCGTSKTESPCLRSQAGDDQCGACGGVKNVYDEVSMYHEDLNVVGHPDLILYLQALSAFYVTELKSISAKAYDELVRPQPDHIIQVLFYWYLMRELGYTIASQVSILYITKGYTFRGTPYKEFVIDAQSAVDGGRLETFIEDARALVTARAGGELPLRVFCASIEDTKAKACEVCKTCFEVYTEAPVTIGIRQAIGATSSTASRLVPAKKTPAASRVILRRPVLRR